MARPALPPEPKRGADGRGLADHLLLAWGQQSAPGEAHVASSTPLAVDPAKHAAQVTRLLRRLHVHQLIAKNPRSRRWRVSLAGRRIMAAAIKLREVAYPGFYADAA
jgi:hypothetical protein